MNWGWVSHHFDAIAALMGTLATILSSLAVRKVGQLHVIVNSRLTELLMVSKASSRAEGKAEGVTQEQARQRS
jgi:hypothetical protein